MRNICYTFVALLAALLLMPFGSMQVQAAGEGMAFAFDLSVDGKDTKEVETGDIITVVLKLRRTDAAEPYTMYAMQDEIRYDSTFFELIEDSVMLNEGIVSTDIAMVDQYREFYMNFLSVNGGARWEDNMLIGTFQLKVTGESGVSTITSRDYLVSLQDGSGSYPCSANEVTIVLSTDCTVSFQTNGGSEIADQVVQFGERITRPEDPVREGYQFAGWYSDIHLKDEWDFAKDTVQGNISLYARWSAVEAEDNTVPDSAPTGDDSHIIVWCLIAVLLIFILVLITYFKRKKSCERTK